MRVRLEELDGSLRSQASREAVRELDKENLGSFMKIACFKL